MLQATRTIPPIETSHGPTSQSWRWNGTHRVASSNHNVVYQGRYPSTVVASLGAFGKSSPITGAETMSAFE